MLVEGLLVAAVSDCAAVSGAGDTTTTALVAPAVSAAIVDVVVLVDVVVVAFGIAVSEVVASGGVVALAATVDASADWAADEEEAGEAVVGAGKFAAAPLVASALCRDKACCVARSASVKRLA